ncbi:MAG: DEAD/DEAH box helicase [Bacteroidales bacterium]|nr:DEAD/DEAH box helicase [Bacteroidales bacterium]
MRFDEILDSDDLLDALWDMHFDECTPIQEAAIPPVSEGRDLIAVAQTGTGKTAAYLLPVIDRLASGEYPEDSVNCIVMAPTRELAQQIDRQLQGFAYFMPISSLPIYGGTDGHTFEQQKRGLTKGADIVIATPGRLIAHLSMGYVDLSRVSFFILDEADRMLDMGFFEDIMQIAKHLPEERQTLLFSATMPPKIQQLASKILRNPAEVKLAVSKPAEKIDQSAYVCYETQKIPLLKSIFATEPPERVIVFSSSKQKVKELSRTLRRDLHLSAAEMHSDLDQKQRDDVMLDFKSGRIKLLIATDIVARGIDIDDIRMVINYDVPHEAEDYVHRIGRTARADRDGKAVTLVTDKDAYKFRRIEQLLEKEVPKNMVPEELGETPSYSSSVRPGAGNAGRQGRKSRFFRGEGKARGRGVKPAKGAQNHQESRAVKGTGGNRGEAVAEKSIRAPRKKRNFHQRRRPANGDEVKQAKS